MSLSKVQNSHQEMEYQKTKHVEKRQEDLKKIDEKFDAQVREAKNNADQRIYEIKDQNHKELLGELETKENKLGAMKNSLKETENIILQEKQKLATDLDNKRTESSLSHEARMKDLVTRHESSTKDLNDKFSLEQKKLNTETQRELARQQLKNFKASNNVRQEYDKKLSEDQRHFTDQKFSQDIQNAAVLRNQKSEFQNEFRIKENLHNEKYAQQQIRQNHERETNRQQSDQLMIMDQKDHEHRFQTQLAKNHEELKNLDNQAKHEMEKIKLGVTRTKQNVDSRAVDPFYSGTILNPQVIEKPDHYLIKIKIPQHEAPLVNMSAKDRNVKLTFNRLADTEVKLEDGSVNKTKKSESLVKEFSVAELVNPKKMERKYEDGFLTYKIAKA